MYNDESVVYEIEKHLDIKPNQDNLQADSKEAIFHIKKNREIIEAIFHPIVHEMIKNSLDISQNLMIELPPIINNYELFQNYKSIYIHTTEKVRIGRCNKRNNIDSAHFDKINALQRDFELIREACDLIICNDNDVDALNNHFEKGIIKK